MIRGAQVGLEIPLQLGTNRFGRTEGFILRDILASRQHMEILCTGSACLLTDLQSTNGTFINGEPVVEAVTLRHGDYIRVGETILAFETLEKEASRLGFGAQTARCSEQLQEAVTLQIRAYPMPGA